MKKTILLFISFSVLVSCDSSVGINEVCEKYPESCEQITPDSWCKRERKEIILTDYRVKETNSDQSKFDLLIANEKYSKCIYKASLIEHRKLKEKKTFRIDNYDRTQKRLKLLAEETKNSSHPDLLFYHWSRFQDKKALQKFLKLEGTKELETPRLQYSLATYYTKKNQNKTIQLLYRSLELVKSKDDVNPDIFRSLSTIYLDKKKYKQAYVWLKVLNLFSEEEVKEKLLKDFSQGYKLDQNRLDSIADLTLDKIYAGTFTSPRA